MGLTVERQGAVAAPGDAQSGAQGSAYGARQPLDVAVRVANVGQEDAVGVRLQLVASRDGDAGSPGQVVGTATFDADAGGSNTVTFVWVPPGAGAWTLRALADRPAGSASAEATLPVPVQRAARPTPQALLVPQAPAVAGLLALLVGVGVTAAFATLATLHPRGQRRAP
jgi:hypothetical protein